MRGRTVRGSIAAATLLLIVGFSLPAWTAPRSGSARHDAAVRLPGVLRREARADVDARLRTQLARGRAAQALVILNGASALTVATASSAGDSQELLRSTVPSYRALKDGFRSRLSGIRVLRDYRTLPILFVRISSREALRRVAADPAVVGVAANRRYRPTLAQSLPLIGQPTVFAQGHTGLGTAVAVLDTGVDFNRPAFGNCAGGPGSTGCKVVLAQDTAPNDGQLDDPAIMHGTNVAGIVVGVAPDTGILAYDVFSGSSAFNSDIIEGINAAIANQAAFNVRAINMSLGAGFNYNTSPCSGGSNPFVAAFSNARAAGIVPVVATGNNAVNQSGNFQAGISNPACTPGALPVAAVYDGNNGSLTWGPPGSQCTDATSAADQITCFSQSWANPMMLAPGALIDAAGIQQGGTSQATPHVAGAVAVLHDAFGVASPSSSTPATPDQIQSALVNSGPLILDPLVNTSFHRLDLPAAVAALGTPPPPPPPGTCTIFGTGGSDLLEDTAGDDVICGEGGSDTIVLSAGGNDVVDGGPGFDFVTLELASSGGTVDLGAGTAVAGGVSATLEAVEGVVGTPFADTIVGDGAANDLFGLGGNDDLDGKGGFDFVRFDFSSKGIKADLLAGSAKGEGRDDFVSIEGFVGSRFDDEAFGDGKANAFFGLAGSDLLAGFGKPDDLFGGPGADGLFGGTGNDDLFGGPGNDFCDQGPGSGTASSC